MNIEDADIDILNEYLFERYLEFYTGEDFHRLMDMNGFIRDPDIYVQIHKLFWIPQDFDKWFFKKHKIKQRNHKINTIIDAQ